MEHHRLKPMVEDYDEKLFNELYKNTEVLRSKLASEIDARRFGYDNKEIKSWFTVKFIHAFNKYYYNAKGIPNSSDLIKANILQALRFFKNRILRLSYSMKNSVNRNTVDIYEVYSLQTEKPDEEHQVFLAKAMEYFKTNLSFDAYQVLNVELHPPLYVYDKINTNNKKIGKIPAQVIADFLGFATPYVNSLRKEIKSVTVQASEEFMSS